MYSRSMWSRNSRSGSARASAGSSTPRQRASAPHVAASRRRRADLVDDLLGQVAHADALLGQDDQPLDHVAQLAHVAGPGVGGQHAPPPRRRSASAFMPFSRAGRLDERRRQQRHVVGAIAQRRRAQGDDGQTEVEVLAELARGHGRLQVAVGRRDDAHLDLQRLLAAHARELARLQHPQHLGLGRAATHVADLVEEDRPAVGHLEEAALARGGPREGAALVAEQLRLDQLRRDGGAVHLDEAACSRERRLAGGWRARSAPCRCPTRR